MKCIDCKYMAGYNCFKNILEVIGNPNIEFYCYGFKLNM